MFLPRTGYRGKFKKAAFQSSLLFAASGVCVMAKKPLDRDTLARSYAERHLKTDPGIRVVYYLPTNAPDREIRFLEVNEMIAERDNDPVEPIDFGLDVGRSDVFNLMVLDVTPAQWEKINKKKLQLPKSWTLKGAIHFSR
jgi:hypothetical protein